MRIAIWGAGTLGRYITQQCQTIMQVVYFVDNDAEKFGTYVDELPVINIDELKRVYEDQLDGVVLGVFSMTNAASIMDQLQKKGIRHVGIFSESIDLEKPIPWEKLLWLDQVEKPVLPYLEVNVIDICNLNCKGCTHFSNLFSGDTEMDLVRFTADLHQIAQYLHVLSIRLLGGEPLLNKHLIDYVKIARNELPFTEIHIVSNGLLLLQQSESFFAVMREHNVRMDISAYPPTQKIKDKLCAILEKQKISYHISKPVIQFYRTLNSQGKSNLEHAHEVCAQSYCAFLRNGKIYPCPFAGMIYKYIECFHMEEFNVDLNQLGIDIYDDKLNWSFLFENLCKPFSLCAYCSEDGGEFFDWQVSKNPQCWEWLTNQGRKSL